MLYVLRSLQRLRIVLGLRALSTRLRLSLTVLVADRSCTIANMTAPTKVTDIQILHVFVSDNKAFELDLSQLFTSDQLGEDPSLRWLAEKARLFTRSMSAFTKRQGIVFEVIGSDPSIEGSAEDIFGAVYRNSFLARAAPRGVTALEGLPAN
jgi:hypothetical protein